VKIVLGSCSPVVRAGLANDKTSFLSEAALPCTPVAVSIRPLAAEESVICGCGSIHLFGDQDWPLVDI
jgi:hypothetical protein